MKCPKCGSEMELHSFPDKAWCCPNPNCYHESKLEGEKLGGGKE